MVHCDLKPRNILFHNGELKISDFGISRTMEGDQSEKRDVWSLGVMFFEMLYGRRPFTKEEHLTTTEVRFPLKPQVSDRSKTFIRRCLTHDVTRRMSVLEAVATIGS